MAISTPNKVALGANALEWRRGWRVALAAAIAYGAGPVMFLTTASVFIVPIMQATGWSTTQVLISPFVSLMFSLFAPVVGRTVDRTSPRKTATVGLIVYAALLALFAFVPLNPFTYYGVGAAIGIAGAFAFIIPVNRAVSSWFFLSSGKAFGLIGVGGASFPLIGVPLTSFVVYSAGWQIGYLVLAGFALLISLPAVVIGLRLRAADTYSHTTEEAVAPTSGAVRVLQSPRFWVLLVSFGFAGGAAVGFLSNMQPIMLGGGMSPLEATSITTLATVGVIIGRLSMGILLDAINRYVATVIMLTLSGIAALVLTQVASLSYAGVLIAALVLTFSQGGEGDVTPVIALREYGRASFSKVYATTLVASGVGSFVAPYIFAFLRDQTRGYTASIILGGALYLGAAVLTMVYGVTRRGERDSELAAVNVEPVRPMEATA